MRRGLIIALLVVAATAVLVGGQFVLDDRRTYHGVVVVTLVILGAALWAFAGSTPDNPQAAAMRRRKPVWSLASLAWFTAIGVAATYQAELERVAGFDLAYVGIALIAAWFVWSLGFLSIFAANVLFWWGPLVVVFVAILGDLGFAVWFIVAFVPSHLIGRLLLRCPRCLQAPMGLFSFRFAPWARENCQRCGLPFHEHSYVDPQAKALRAEWEARRVH